MRGKFETASETFLFPSYLHFPTIGWWNDFVIYLTWIRGCAGWTTLPKSSAKPV